MSEEADDKCAHSDLCNKVTRGLQYSLCGQCGRIGPRLADRPAAADGKPYEGSSAELRRNQRHGQKQINRDYA